LIGLGFAGFLLLEFINNRFWLPDFEVYYKAAERLLSGNNLYRYTEDGHYVYKYSPATALYFIPFTIFNLHIAKIIYWFMLSAVIIWVLHLSFQLSLNKISGSSVRINTIILLAFIVQVVHFQRELHLGQVNVILLLLYIGMLIFYRKGRPAITGLLWALSIFIKPFGLIFLPWFAVKRYYKEILFFTLFTVILFLSPLLFYTKHEYLQQTLLWINELSIELGNKQDLFLPSNHTIFSVLVRYSLLQFLYFSNTAILIYQLVVLSAIGIAFLWFIFKGRFNSDNNIYEFAILISLIPLLSFTSHNAFCFTTLAVFILMQNFKAFSKLWQVLIITGFVFIGFNFHDVWGHELSKLINDLSLVSVGAILIIIALFRWRAVNGFDSK